MKKKIDYSRYIKLEKGCQLVNIIWEIIDGFNNEMPGYELDIKGNINRIFAWLVRNNHIKNDLHIKMKSMDMKRIEDYLIFLENNYYKNITLNDAAKMVYMNYYYFSRAFKRLTGKPFIKYLNTLRIREAEKLLLNTEEKISVISENTGFLNVDWFEKLFKNEKGMTPFEYRIQNRLKKVDICNISKSQCNEV